jgi:creatinine amidohydrolase
MNLDEHTWTDIRDADTDLALLPVGSTEQHGPHAPLGVDMASAEAIAEAAAERYADEHGEDPVVAPAVPVGVAEEHRAFDGSLWVSEDTFRSYVADVCRSGTVGDRYESDIPDDPPRLRHPVEFGRGPTALTEESCECLRR